MKQYRNPNAIERCMECKALFGNRFTEERVIYDNGKFVVCKDCSRDIDMKNNPMFCIHCRIKLDIGKVAVSQEVRGGWYCDVCIQEMNEREKPYGDSYPELIKAFDRIRKVRNEKGNYKDMLKNRRERINEIRAEEVRRRGGKYD